MYAIVKTGGKQYKVAAGGVIIVEKIEGERDDSVELTEVLMISGDDGAMQVGAPTVAGAKVIARIIEQGKNKKINGFTYKPKKNIHHRYGHRQKHTKLHIQSIES